ncbi:MAG: DUF6320 domain-containing protein [Candidatus Limiplasma sp.]|nr:DUF6320 domain-containing protein [Candidatus Limiplasma sp.]MEA5145892.1 DUF6320 domain-containing protein [Candidatus Limiplasma sp.]
MQIPKMQVHITYPEIQAHSFWRRNHRELMRAVFVFAAYACAFINIALGGIPWALAAIGGMAVLWIAVFYKPLVENTAIKKITDVGIAACLYLFLLDEVLGGGWSALVVPIVLFADLIVAGTFFLAFFKKEKRNFLPLFELTLGGFVAILTGLVGWNKLDWPLIVVGSVSMALVVLTAALHWKEIKVEFRKKMHW